jgi:Arc/MetJ-type ribon-helix-helix transcriptional regulator
MGNYRNKKKGGQSPDGIPKRICTINVPITYLDNIKLLVDMGFYNSRSELIREALKDFLDREKQFISDLTNKTIKILGEKI